MMLSYITNNEKMERTGLWALESDGAEFEFRFHLNNLIVYVTVNFLFI